MRHTTKQLITLSCMLMVACQGAPTKEEPSGAEALHANDGLKTLMEMVPEAMGVHCPWGGQRLSTGLDQNGNGQLELIEVDNISYVCHGAQGDDGQDGVDGQDGQNGVDGQDGQNGVDGIDTIHSGNEPNPAENNENETNPPEADGDESAPVEPQDEEAQSTEPTPEPENNAPIDEESMPEPEAEDDDVFNADPSFDVLGCGVGGEIQADLERQLDTQRSEQAHFDTQSDGDGGGASIPPEQKPGFGPQRVMTVLLEVGERRFSQEELTSLPHLIYGAEAGEEAATPELSVNDTFIADSYDQTSIVGIDGEPGGADDILGPFQVSWFNCNYPYLALQQVLDNDAQAWDPGPLAEGAKLLVVVRKENVSCPYAGVAMSGRLRSPALPDGLLRFPFALSLNTQRRTIAHELGHIMGMGHTGITQCEGEHWNNIPYVNNTNAYAGHDACGTRTYADWLGFMGLGGRSRMTHSGAVAKEAWGWLSEREEAQHKIASVEESGFYNIKSISDHVVGTKAIKVPFNHFLSLYVEYRQHTNADGSLSADHSILGHPRYQQSDVFSGALLRLGTGGSMPISLLFDPYRFEDEVNLWDTYEPYTMALPFGESYTLPLTGTQISIEEAADGESMDIDVQLGRTDFTRPAISYFGVDQAKSSACDIVVRGDVSDDSGISELILLAEHTSGLLNDYEQIFLPAENGAFEYVLDARRFAGGEATIIAYDDAQSAGGLAPNNGSGLIIDLPVDYQGERCDIAPPSLNIRADEGAQVHRPFNLEFEVDDASTLIEVRLEAQAFEGDVAFGETELLFFHADDFDWLTSLDESVPLELTPGRYQITLTAIDAHGYGETLQQTIEVLPGIRFLRGDTNGDGYTNESDISYLKDWLFYDGQAPACADAADANGDGVIDMSDLLYLSSHLVDGHTIRLPDSPGLDLTHDERCGA
jgi:hypothetical protein